MMNQDELFQHILNLKIKKTRIWLDLKMLEVFMHTMTCEEDVRKARLEMEIKWVELSDAKKTIIQAEQNYLLKEAKLILAADHEKSKALKRASLPTTSIKKNNRR